MIGKETNTFDHLDNSKVLVLEGNFDGLILDGNVYVINEKQFSFMTGYYQKEINQANSILDDVDKIGLIRDFDKLRTHCTERISYVKRLSKLDLDTLRKADFDKIKKLKEKRGTDFIIDEGSKTISFESEDQIKNVVDLILDNFVISEVTDEPYRAVNKYKDKKA